MPHYYHVSFNLIINSEAKLTHKNFISDKKLNNQQIKDRIKGEHGGLEVVFVTTPKEVSKTEYDLMSPDENI
jgi:hypothetical protein